MEMTLQQLADQYGTAREMRLQMEKDVEKFAKTERELKAELLRRMPLEEISVIGGMSWKVKLNRTDEPHVKDWPQLWAHIMETGDFDLLQKRVTPDAVKARWERNEDIPGVEKFPVDNLSVTHT